MNIINLDAAGDVVDPEDWSPQRTQYMESLAAGKSVTLSWRVNAILDGDYLVYMVLHSRARRRKGDQPADGELCNPPHRDAIYEAESRRRASICGGRSGHFDRRHDITESLSPSAN